MITAVQLATSNPFNSRQISPGAIDYIFPAGESLGTLLKTLRNNWRGQIIGPHGTGKSTLLKALVPELCALGTEVRWGTFQGGRQQWKFLPNGKSADVPSRIVVIDGFEQLNPLARWRWLAGTYVLRQGLVITTHQPVRLPLLHQTHVTPELAQQIATELAGELAHEVQAEVVAELLTKHEGNMRDTLFALYDLFESCRR